MTPGPLTSSRCCCRSRPIGSADAARRLAPATSAARRRSDAIRRGAQRLGRRRAATTSRCGGTRRAAAALGVDFARRRRPAAANAQRRRAEATGARVPAARRGRHPRARRARQLPRRPGQAVAGAASSTPPRRPSLFVSHDRELLAAGATKIVTIEASGAWSHGGGFATYAEAKAAHADKRGARHRAVRRREASASRTTSC